MGEPKINGGYILISRKIVESEIWEKPPLYIKVWIYLLTRAQHNDFKRLKRGQLITSIPEIIEACSWKVGYRKEKPTKDQIYQVIDWLRKGYEVVNEADTKATMITTTKATHGLLINIDNYDFYQTPKNYESNSEDDNEKDTKATREQRQPDNINKNYKNVKNDKNENKKSNSPKQVYDETSPYYQIAKTLSEEIKKNLPEQQEPNLQKWSDDIRKIVEIDKRDPKQVIEVIKWVQKDDFWWKNILSPSKLRKQYVKLLANMKPRGKQTYSDNEQSKVYGRVINTNKSTNMDMDIAFSKYIEAGGKPHRFDWTTGKEIDDPDFDLD